MMYTIDSLTTLIVQSYDRNRDNRIQTKRGHDFEAERLVRQVQPGYDADTVSLSWVSHETLFLRADSNGDGYTDRSELRAQIALFDRNLNGQLENEELGLFQQSFPVTQGTISSERIAKVRPGAQVMPDMGYTWFAGLPRALGSQTVGRSFTAIPPSKN